MDQSLELKQYAVQVTVYTWAEDPAAAIEQVVAELDYLTSVDFTIAGYLHPELDAVKEDLDP